MSWTNPRQYYSDWSSMSPNEQALAQQYWDIGMNINAVPLPDYDSYLASHTSPYSGPKNYETRIKPGYETTTHPYFGANDEWYSFDNLRDMGAKGGRHDTTEGTWYNDGTWLISPTGNTFAVADLERPDYDYKNPRPYIEDLIAKGSQYAAGAQPGTIDWSFTKEGTPVYDTYAKRFEATDAERAAYAEQVKRETGKEVANNDQWLALQRRKDRNSTESAADALINSLAQRFGLSVAGKGPNADPNYVAPVQFDRRAALGQAVAMPTLELPGMATLGMYGGIPSASGAAPGSASAEGLSVGNSITPWSDFVESPVGSMMAGVAGLAAGPGGMLIKPGMKAAAAYADLSGDLENRLNLITGGEWNTADAVAKAAVPFGTPLSNQIQLGDNQWNESLVKDMSGQMTGGAYPRGDITMSELPPPTSGGGYDGGGGLHIETGGGGPAPGPDTSNLKPWMNLDGSINFDSNAWRAAVSGGDPYSYRAAWMDDYNAGSTSGGYTIPGTVDNSNPGSFNTVDFSQPGGGFNFDFDFSWP